MLISCSRKWRAPGGQNLRSWRYRIGWYSVWHISVPGGSVKWLSSWCNEWMCFDVWLRWMQYWIRKCKTKCFQYFISVVVFVFQQKNRSIIFLADALLLLLLLFYFYCFCISFFAPLKLEKILRQPKVLLKKIRHSNQND